MLHVPFAKREHFGAASVVEIARQISFRWAELRFARDATAVNTVYKAVPCVFRVETMNIGTGLSVRPKPHLIAVLLDIILTVSLVHCAHRGNLVLLEVCHAQAVCRANVGPVLAVSSAQRTSTHSVILQSALIARRVSSVRNRVIHAADARAMKSGMVMSAHPNKRSRMTRVQAWIVLESAW